MTIEEYQELIQQFRDFRNLRLIQTDWTQLPDAPLTNKEEWATYRQQLRDYMNIINIDNIEEIPFPLPPEVK